MALWNGYKGIVVISGEGVKEYYSKKGYSEKDTFMYRDFYKVNLYKMIEIIVIIIVIMLFMYIY